MPESLLALIIAELAKQVPALAIDIIQIIKNEGTDADWTALRAKWNKPADSFFKTPPQPPV